jgi:hypothetical protein
LAAVSYWPVVPDSVLEPVAVSSVEVVEPVLVPVSPEVVPDVLDVSPDVLVEPVPDVPAGACELDEDDVVSPVELCDHEEDELVPWSASMLPPCDVCQAFSSSRDTLPSAFASIALKLPASAGAAAVSSCSDSEPSALVSACVQWLVDIIELASPVADALLDGPTLLFDEFG